MGLAIFGITEVPTDGVEFDTGDFVAGSAESSDYIPAPGDPSTDPELGGGVDDVTAPPSMSTQSTTPFSTTLDVEAQTQAEARRGEFSELD